MDVWSNREDRSANRMRALIVDNKDGGRRMLRSLLATIPDVDVIAEATNAEETLTKISELSPDLVLIEVGMPEVNGVDLVRDLDMPPGVIFVAGDQEYAALAFEVGAIDYLVRPVRQHRFAASMIRAKRRIAECRIAQFALRIAGVAGAMNPGMGNGGQQAAKYPQQMRIRVRRRLFWLDVADIVWIQGASQYSRVHGKSGEFLLARSLSSLECELDPKRFFRIHRSAIVNAGFVQEIRTSGDGRYNIHIQGGLALPMGRSRREILAKLMDGVGRSVRMDS
jgi:two-component system LytT family response regulator